MANKPNIAVTKRLQRALTRFGEDVQRRRAKLDLTQKEAAHLAGISQSNWSKIERGLHDPSVGQALRIQFALGAESLEGMLGDQPSALVLASDGKPRQRGGSH
jgi:transcriptional regulator with XRE-family HTH domain